MKTPMKKILTALAVAIGLTTAQAAETPRTISINFDSDRGSVSGTYGIVPSSSWNNFSGATQSSEKSVTVSDGTTGVTAMWWSKNTYGYSTGVTDNALKGYLDDGACGDGATSNGPHICIKGIPFDYYDVIIYHATDTENYQFNPAAFKEWTKQTECGSQAYSYDGKTMAARNDASLKFGKSRNATAVYGTNVSYLKKAFTWKNLDIKGGANANSARGGIAAIQIVETAAPVDYSVTLDQPASWTGAGWDPTLPETGMTEKDTATVTATGNPTLTLDGTITVGKLVVKSNEGDMLTLKKGLDANTSFGSLDVSEAVDGTTWDSTEGFTACSALLNAMRAGENKFYFLGADENGATITYERAGTKTFPSHLVFEGGKHKFTYGQNGERDFGANATEENPTILVKKDTILDFYGHDLCGWTGTANLNGIIKIEDGGRIYMKQEGGTGTVYYRQRISLDPGGQFYIDMQENNFRLQGGTAEATAQIYMPASEGGVAYIKPVEVTRDSIYLATDSTKGVAVKVEDGSTLDIQAKLASANNQDCEVKKYGAGTLKLSGGVSGFQGKLTVAAGTLEYATATALGAAATIAVDEGATLKIAADEDLAFANTVSGSGTVVKAGAGTLGVTPGQFGDNLVSIEDGDLAFTITHEQAASGVVLCKAATDISGNVTVVNAAGEELEGAFTFADNTLSFKANCVDLYLVIDDYSPASWSSLIEGEGWIDSPESTITITNKTTVTFWFDVPITAKSLKIVGASSDVQLGISYEDFPNLTIGSYDFTEAVSEVGGVAINCEDAPANAETRIITGATIAGFENVVPMDDDVPDGTGFYKDASNIWLCKQYTDVTRTSPTTADVQAFTNFFVGVTSGDWADKANWRTAKDGLLVPYQYAKYPQSTEAQNANWFPACFDGALIEEFGGTTEITCANVEGWKTALCFCNGVSVSIERMKKFADWFMWIDESSSVAIDTLGGSSFQYGYVFNVAGQLTIGTFEGNIANIPYTYNLGDEAVVTYTDGVKTGTHALNGGSFVAEGDGIAAAISVTNDVSVTTPAIKAAVTIRPESTLALTSTAEGDLAIGGNWTNDGTLEAVEGTIVFKPGVTPGDYTENGGKVILGQTVTINDCGKVAVTGETEDDVRLFDIGGEPVEVTEVAGGYAYYEWDVAGKNCWWDYEFEGNLKSAGTDTATMSEEGTTPYYNEDETALRVGYGTPYRSVTYPEEFTAVIYGKMVNTLNHMEIGFGSTYTGSKLGVVIACGDPSKNEVKLLVTSEQTTVLETVPMTVTDPYDTDHLYAFTCQTVGEGEDAKTKVSVYVDGKFLQAYTFASKVTLGPGFQVGSIFGGLNVNYLPYKKATTANTHADLDFLRVYQTVLSAEAMAKYAEKYPYTSKAGASVRTFAEDADWTVAEGTPWTVTPFEAEPAQANAALAGSQVTVSATAAAEVTMNLAEATTYESLTVNAGSAITLKAGDEAVEPTITGLTTIKADVTVGYDAIKFGNVEVASGKTLTFDFDGFPFADYYQDATIPFTGATSGEGTITATGLPQSGTRTATFVKNASTDQYELKITVDASVPFIYTIAQGEEGTWTFGGEEVTEEIVDANTSVAIWKEGDGTLTKELVKRAYVVNEGLFVTTNAAGVYATITVNENGTFDFNGSADSFATVNLAGGKLVNNGGEMGTGSRQMQNLAITADSTVGGTGNFGLISGGYAANTLDLGGATLTKEGANTFFLCDTTVTNGTFDVTAGAIKTVGYDADVTKFAADATLNLGAGTTLDVAAPLEIAAITANGATINNAKSITPFTLTGSATLAGNGTWGTNTIDGATVTIGTKRGLVFNGEGTVNVTLTQAEYDGELPITLFEQGESGASAIGTVTYDDQDITSKCTISGNQITAIEKTPPVPEWMEGAGEENVQKYNAWAATYGVTDPTTAKKDAFLLNVANDDEAIEDAKKEFTLTISFDDEGKPVVECPNEDDYNGTVIVKGKAALTDDEWHAQTEGDQFFQATLELISAN